MNTFLLTLYRLKMYFTYTQLYHYKHVKFTHIFCNYIPSILTIYNYYFSDVWLTVLRNSMWIKKTN